MAWRKVGTWYLVARQSSGLRTFRVSRMARVVMLAELFERPANFYPGGYWARTAAHPDSLQDGFGLPDEAALALGRWKRIELAPSDAEAAHLPPDWSLYRIHFRIPFDDECQALFVTRVRHEAQVLLARGKQ